MFITWQTVITAGAVIGALSAIITLLIKLVRFIDRQKAQDEELKKLHEKHDREMSEFKKEESAQIVAIKQEQTLLTCGILACLKGLKEQGCNGPVTEAIAKIEKHLNKKAHE
jgi:H+/gluconate symporter-like permease